MSPDHQQDETQRKNAFHAQQMTAQTAATQPVGQPDEAVLARWAQTLKTHLARTPQDATMLEERAVHVRHAYAGCDVIEKRYYVLREQLRAIGLDPGAL